MSSHSRNRQHRKLRAAVAAVSVLSTVVAPIMPAVAQTATPQVAATTSLIPTQTPIKHVIMIIGENRTFDHVFATYQPSNGEKVNNLLSEGIVKVDGTAGANFNKAAQSQATDTTTYMIAPTQKSAYTTLPPAATDGAPTSASDTNPPPFASTAAVAATEEQIFDGLPIVDYKLLTTGATGLPGGSVDTRITNAATLPNGPFQITGPNMPYDSYTASPVHRFYQMWQETDCSATHTTTSNPSGCLNDLFPWVETSVGAGTNGSPQASPFTNLTTGEGSTSMGFFNMSTGDVPYFKYLADTYTISDNFHQSIMGGTGANHIAIGTGLGMYYSDGQGHIATPPSNEIENPNPQSGTNNWYVQDGYSGGSYSNCSDASQPGVGQVLNYLSTLPTKPASKCAPGAYYLLNNYNPGYFGDGTVNTSTFTIPPSSVPTIGDSLNARHISWRYYGAGWDNYVKDPNSDIGSIYCNICNPFLYTTSIMANPLQRETHLKDVPDLQRDIAENTLPPCRS